MNVGFLLQENYGELIYNAQRLRQIADQIDRIASRCSHKCRGAINESR
jgi:hypothetical protein